MAHAAVAVVSLMIIDGPGGFLIQLFLIPRRQGLALNAGIDRHMNLFDRQIQSLGRFFLGASAASGHRTAD